MLKDHKNKFCDVVVVLVSLSTMNKLWNYNEKTRTVNKRRDLHLEQVAKERERERQRQRQRQRQRDRERQTDRQRERKREREIEREIERERD